MHHGRQYPLLLVAIAAALLLSCKEEDVPTTPNPPNDDSIVVTLVTADYTALSLQLQTSTSGDYALERNGEYIWQGRVEIPPTDTIVADNGLVPSTNYRYRLLRFEEGAVTDSSNVTVARTRDTTSSDFEWEVTYFGDVGANTFRDVAVIAPDDIWAVGDVNFLDDSTGKLITYNAAHWDGETWEFHLIPFKRILPGGQVDSIKRGVIYGVYSPQPDIVWFLCERGGGATRYSYGAFEILELNALELPGGATAIWGRSTNDYYVTSDAGRLHHWNGTKFNRIETGTTEDVIDIWGAGDTAICMICDWDAGNQKPTLLCVVGETATPFPNENMPSTGMKSLWFERQNNITAVGSRIRRWDGMLWGIEPYFSDGYQMRIRGAADDDLISAGQRGDFLHYNGYRWNKFIFQEQNESMYPFAMTYNGNDVYIVGFAQGGRKALFVHGKRK